MNPSERRFDILSHVVEIANTSVDVNERLDTIMGTVNGALGARLTMLFMQEQAQDRLVQSHACPPGSFRGRRLSVDFGKGHLGRTASTREPIFVRMAKPAGEDLLDEIAEENELAVILPVMDDNRLYAVMAMIFSPGLELPSQDHRLLQMVSREMAGVIRNYRLYFEAKKRIAELNVLSDLGRAAVSTIDVGQFLRNVVGICSKLLGAGGGVVQVRALEGEPIGLSSVFGRVPPGCNEGADCMSSCGLQGSAQENQKVQPLDLSSSGDDIGEGLCAALSFKGRYEGRLCVFDKTVYEKGALGEFGLEDQNLLFSMSSMVSAGLENALSFQRVEDLAQRNEEMVRALATLFEISTFLLTTVDFDETVQIILQAVTHPAGLDHDRVILFLVDEKEQVLRPVADMAKADEGSKLSELMQTLADIKKQPEVSRAGLLEDGLADLTVRLEPEKSVIARTVAEKRAIKVDNPAHDRNVSRQYLETLGAEPFVSVPMFAKSKVVGALVVNNRRSKRPFGDRDVKLLAMLASLGGLAVENSRLYQHLESANRELAAMRDRLLEAEKLAALGEVAAGVAHEIRNPLVSIGGFAKRLRKLVAQESPVIRKYLEVIIEETTRLEATLNEMLDFSTDVRGNFEEHDLATIMEDAVQLMARDLNDADITVKRHFAAGLPKVFCDDRQIKHVFLNLCLNAKQAMNGEPGELTLRTFSVTREGKQFVAGELSDTGGGIAMDVIHRIFNPFFTTKDTGSGLGLSMVYKIVTRHFGTVEVHNREGEGAAFLIILPAAEEGRAYYHK